jgi:hypothetical protein
MAIEAPRGTSASGHRGDAMPDLVDRLAHEVASRIRQLGFDEPNRKVAVEAGP